MEKSEAESAIERSQKTKKIVYVRSEFGTSEELFDACDDYSEDGDECHYWGEDSSGKWDVVTTPIGDPRITL